MNNKHLLENRKANLTEKYEAIFNHRENTLNEGDKITLTRQLAQLESEIKKVENELKNTHKITRNIPDLRSYLINRVDQKRRLRQAIAAHNKQYPFLCLIHGGKYQCHDRFFDCLVHYDLPQLTQFEEIPCHFLHCRFYKGISDLHQEISDALCDKLGIFANNPVDIMQAIAKERRPILFYASMCTEDWSQGGMDLVLEFIKFWSTWSLPANTKHLLLICLSVNYIDESQGFFNRLFKKTSLNDQIRQALQDLQFSELGVNGIVLPELKNIIKQEVEHWVNTHLRDCLEIFSPEIEKMFKSGKNKTMQDIVDQFSRIIKDHCT